MTNYTLCIGGFRVKTPNAQQGFCVRRAEVQNSTVVFQLNFSNNIGFCASISRPNAKPRPLAARLRSTANRQLPFKTKRADTIKASAPTN